VTATLKKLIGTVEDNPDLIHSSELMVFKSYLVKQGVKFPDTHRDQSAPGEHDHHEGSKEKVCEGDPEVILNEDPLHLVMDRQGQLCILVYSFIFCNSETWCVSLGDFFSRSFLFVRYVVSSEDDQEGALQAKTGADEALRSGDSSSAVTLYTRAISLGGGGALVHARRAQALLSLKQPRAALKDAEKAVTINPDSAIAYRARGQVSFHEAPKDNLYFLNAPMICVSRVL
jgi:suppressor of tumorigenicity protein 13